MKVCRQAHVSDRFFCFTMGGKELFSPLLECPVIDYILIYAGLDGVRNGTDPGGASAGR